MNDQHKAKYMANFAQFSPTKRRKHIIMAVAFLTRLLAAQRPPLALDDPDVIDGEYTQGDAA